jgi:hypothetical protein
MLGLLLREGNTRSLDLQLDLVQRKLFGVEPFIGLVAFLVMLQSAACTIMRNLQYNWRIYVRSKNNSVHWELLFLFLNQFNSSQFPPQKMFPKNPLGSGCPSVLYADGSPLCVYFRGWFLFVL